MANEITTGPQEGEIEPRRPKSEELPPPPATEPPEPAVTEPPSTEPPATQAAAPKPSKAPWFMDRIGEESAKRRQAEAERDELLQRLAAVTPSTTTTTPSTASTPFVPAQAKAPDWTNDQIQLAAKTLNVKEAGIKEFGETEFKAAMEGYSALASSPEEAENFIMAALETEVPHKVLHFLGTNPEEANKIMKLSPRRQVIEMDRLAQKLLTPTEDPPVSKAPPPIKPVGGSAKPEVNPDKMSTAEWIKWREKDIAEKRKQGIRIH